MGFFVDRCSRNARAFFFFISCLSILVHSSLARDMNLKWEVEYMHWSPDCIESVVMGINGQFPGPTVKARAGDTLNIELTNKLYTEGVVIHWHGITQIGTPWADGTASILQCAINAGETFVYRFKVEKAGTFFYHGHYGMQRSAGLYGALLVSETDRRREPFRYDGEFTLLLSDWWHQNVQRQEVDLSAKPVRFIGEPQTLLMNGRGQYNCSVAAHYDSSSTLCKFKENDRCVPQVIHVQPNNIYRIRVASTTALSSLNLMIGNHKLEVVEADGNYVEPFLVDDLDIYSGESYSVLLKTDQSSTQNYWISIGVRGRHPMTPPALTILNYSPTPKSKHPASKPPVHPRWDDYDHSKSFSNKVQARMGYNRQPPNKYDRRILLLNTQNLINGQTKWSINNISLSLPSTPYLGAIKYGLDNAFNQQSPPDTYSDLHDIMKPPVNPNSTYGNGVYTLAYNTTIDVILQNANALKHNTSEVHPWHLHGHDFWVLGYGEGKFTNADVTKFNLVNPPLRNTVVIYPFGWTALRFVTDNPGVWAFHCHIEPHLHMGMGVIFAEAVEHIKKMKVNKEALTCGLTAKRFMNSHN